MKAPLICVGLVAVAALLAGCKDYGRCLASHAETGIMLLPVSNGTTTTLIPMPITNEVCDRWEFPEGRDTP